MAHVGMWTLRAQSLGAHTRGVLHGESGPQKLISLMYIYIYVVVSLNYCSQNVGNLYRAPYYNGNPNIGTRIIGNLDQSPCIYICLYGFRGLGFWGLGFKVYIYIYMPILPLKLL